MNILSMFSAPVDKILDSFGNAIDKNVTNDEERAVLKNQLIQIKNSADIELKKIDIELEQQITERHKNDMASDAWLSKNVRPMSLVFLLGIVSVLAISDGNLHWNTWVFTVAKEYVELFETLLVTVFGFYFSSRGIEKLVTAFKR